jgi:hypothetical protein
MRRSAALGHRHDRRRAVAAREQRPTACIIASSRRARREGEGHRAAVRWAQPASTRTASSALVVDQRVHRHHVVEVAERRVEHVAAAEVDAPAAARRAVAPAARSRASPPASATGRWPPRGAAPRGLDRQRAGAAAGVQQAQAVQVGGSQDSSVARMRSRPARTVARMRLTGASEVSWPRPRRPCGRSRLDLAAALFGRRWVAAIAQSKPSRSKMSRSFSGTPSAGRCRPTGWRPGACIPSARPQLGRVLHLEQRGLLQPAAADDVEVGEARHRLQADAR